MEELKIKDLFRGKLGIFMLILLVLTVVLLVLKVMGTLEIGYDIAILPVAFDLTIIAIYLVAKFL